MGDFLATLKTDFKSNLLDIIAVILETRPIPGLAKPHGVQSMKIPPVLIPFAAGLILASLAGCSHAPLSASDCGRQFQGGSGLLGLAGAMGAFDREAGADCQLDYAASSYGGSPPYIPQNDVRIPPDPAPLPLPDNRPRLLVPAGGGNLMEIGGEAPQLMVPAGGGTFMEIP